MLGGSHGEAQKSRAHVTVRAAEMDPSVCMCARVCVCTVCVIEREYTVCVSKNSVNEIGM